MLGFLTFFNNLFAAIGSLFKSPILLILRLFFGIGFMLAGWGKLQDISQFSDYLLTLHVPYPETMAWVGSLTELIGGALLVVGFLSRIAAVPLIVMMCVAYATAHIDVIHNLLINPSEFVSAPPFNYLLTSLLVFAFGPGVFSFDALLHGKDKHMEQKLAK